MIDRLTEAVAAVCPIDGIGTLNSGAPIGPGNVRVDYKLGATQPQRDAAVAVVAAFDWSQGAHDIWIETRNSAVKFATTGKRLEVDATTNLATLQDITALKFQLAPGKAYSFEFSGSYTTSNTATGIGLAINGPVGASGLIHAQIFTSAAGASVVGSGRAYDVALQATTGPGPSVELPFFVWGHILTNSQGGALVLRGKSETAGQNVTVKQYSQGLLTCLN